MYTRTSVLSQSCLVELWSGQSDRNLAPGTDLYLQAGIQTCLVYRMTDGFALIYFYNFVAIQQPIYLGWSGSYKKGLWSSN